MKCPKERVEGSESHLEQAAVRFQIKTMSAKFKEERPERGGALHPAKTRQHAGQQPGLERPHSHSGSLYHVFLSP